MKVIRIVPSLDFGGLEQRVYLTVQGFCKKTDFSMQVIVLGNGGSTAERLKTIGKNPQLMRYSYKIPNFLLIFKLTLLLRKYKPDVVHTSSAEGNFHGLIAARLAKVPIRIGEEIGFPNHRFLARFIFKWVYSLATKIIAISNSVKDRIVQLKEVNENFVQVVYNPVILPSNNELLSNSLFLSKNKEFSQLFKSNSFTFISVCRLVPIKNIEFLLISFSKLKHFDVNLWIVGDGPDRESLEKLASTLGISSKITFWGFQTNIALFLSNADAFVLPSYSEGFSISLVEAMLCGLPCIATKVGGPSELIQDEVSGFLIDPLDSQELLTAMKKLMYMSEKERYIIGKNANTFAKKFSVQNYVDQLFDIYQQP